MSSERRVVYVSAAAAENPPRHAASGVKVISSSNAPTVTTWTIPKEVEEEEDRQRQLPTEVLDQAWLNSTPPSNPSQVNIFDQDRVVLFRGQFDALVAERYINESGIKAVEIKYYNETFGTQARSFMLHWNYNAVSGSNVFPNIRRTPILVGPSEYASLGSLMKPAGGSGRFGYLFFVDAAVNATPVGVVNNDEVFIGDFINSF